VGVEGADPGEVKGTVVLKLVPRIDTENFVFMGGFEVESSPKFKTRRLTADRSTHPLINAQIKAFMQRFIASYESILKRLNRKGGRLFKNDTVLQEFKTSPAGTVSSKEKGVAFPFMGNRYKWRIKLKITAD